MMHLLKLLVMGLAAVFCSLPGQAQPSGYPTRPIHVQLGFPAGGGADIVGRHLIARLQAVSGKTFVLENKPGAGSNVATVLVSRAKPDGYTLLMGTSSSLVGSRFFFKSVSFDPKALTPIHGLLEATFVLITGNNTPAKTAPELAAWLKTRPKNRFAYSNQLGLLAGHYFRNKAGFPAEAVSYRSAPEAYPDVQSGLIEFMVADGASAVKPIQDGRLRGIGTTSVRRQPALPELAALREQGYDDADFSTWWALFAPAGTDPKIITTLTGWTKAIFATDETAKFLWSTGNVPLDEDGSSFSARIVREAERWEPLVKAAGIMPE